MPTPVTPASELAEAYPPATPASPEPPAAYPEAESTTLEEHKYHIDGQIGPNEYQREDAVGSFTLWWGNDAEYLYVAMQGVGTGWVAIGLDPSNRMQGANFIVGAVIDGQTTIWDAFGMAPVGPNHPEDTSLGGTMDVISYAGVEQDGRTLIEFQIPLDSGDKYDKPLLPGQSYPVIVATGSTDEFASMHTYHSKTRIALTPAD